MRFVWKHTGAIAMDINILLEKNLGTVLAESLCAIIARILMHESDKRFLLSEHLIKSL